VTDREAYIILNLLSGIGPARASSLAALCGSPAAIFEHTAEDLARIRGVSDSLAAKILAWQDFVDPEEEFRIAERSGVDIVTPADERYPRQLREIHDAPLCLYVRGSIPEETEARSIAMVGTRNASRYGASMARHLAESAAYSGWVTVSGLAVGIDTIVHRATLDAGGKTVAVLGGGLARFHPQENIPLARAIVENGGAVITEFPMTFSPSRHSFPMRNRIISGLSLGTLVIEAGLSSGSLITAAHALEQGKRVFAVPGEADASGSNGCNALIRKGATLVENFEHILEDFEFLPGFDPNSDNLALHDDSGEYGDAADPAAGLPPDESLSETDRKILDILRAEGPLSTEQIALKTELPPPDVMSALIALEILRRIRKDPDGTFRRMR